MGEVGVDMLHFRLKRRACWQLIALVAAVCAFAMPSTAFAADGEDSTTSGSEVIARGTVGALSDTSDDDKNNSVPGISNNSLDNSGNNEEIGDDSDGGNADGDGADNGTDDGVDNGSGTGDGTNSGSSDGNADSGSDGGIDNGDNGTGTDDGAGNDGTGDGSNSGTGTNPDDGIDGEVHENEGSNPGENPPANNLPSDEASGEEEAGSDTEEIKPVKPPQAEGIENGGTYLIQSGVSGNQVFDVANGSTSNGANVQTYESNMSAAQKWQFVYDFDTGYYTIKLAGTDKVLDVANALAKEGANVQIFAANGSDAQKWQIVKKGSSYIFISKLDSNLVIDLAAAGTANGTNVQIWTANGSNAQCFYLIPTSVVVDPGEVLEGGDGSYIIVVGGEDSNKVVDVASSSSDNGANVQIWDNHDSGNQKFYFKYDGKGYYTIYSLSSGKVLDADKGNLIPGTNVHQWDGNGGLQQKWALRDAGDGAFYLINVANGLALDIFSGQFVNGANVQTYTWNKSKAQKFWIVPCKNLAEGPGFIISDGDYVIESSSNLAMVIDVENGSKNNGSNVQIYQSNMSSAQRWTFTRQGDSEYYTITLCGTDFALDVRDASLRDGANVHIYKANGSNAQLWKIVKQGDEFLLVSKIRPDLVIDLLGGGVINGTNVQVYTANGSSAQKFYLLAVNPEDSEGATNSIPPSSVADKEGSFVIGVGPGKGEDYAVDIAGGVLGNGANTQIYEKNESGAQRFYFSKGADGYYTITVIGTGKVLDVKDANLVQGTNVQQWENNGSDAQKWLLIKNDDGSYSIINKATGLALDVANALFANGSNIQVYRRNNYSDSQKFWLEPISILNDGIYTINPIEDPNKVFDVQNGSNGNGAPIQIYESNNSLAQRFELVYDKDTDTYWIRTAASGGWITGSDGSVVQSGSSEADRNASNGWKLVWNGTFFSLLNSDTNSVVTLGAGGTANGSALTMAIMNGTGKQHFLFLSAQLVANGLYEIHSGMNSSLVLDVAGGASHDGANIQIYKDNNSVAQKFYITKVTTEDGVDHYIIKNFASQKVVDVLNGSKDVGANIQQWLLNNSDAQLWRIEIADGGGIMFINVGSGHILSVASNNNVYQDVKGGVSTRAQAWTIEETQGYGWVSQNGTWYFYYRDGTSQAFTNAAYSAYQAIQNWSSKTNYLIVIDNANFRTVVFQGHAGAWEPIKDWICSVGTTNRHDPTYGITARGVFEVLGKGYIMGNDPDYYYWTEFFIPSGSPDGEGQRFHSTGYYRGTGYPGVQYDTTIGHAETHGCVRLWLEEAKWIYDNIPIGTLVYSYPYA